jgi:hypothetical protein
MTVRGDKTPNTPAPAPRPDVGENLARLLSVNAIYAFMLTRLAAQGLVSRKSQLFIHS